MRDVRSPVGPIAAQKARCLLASLLFAFAALTCQAPLALSAPTYVTSWGDYIVLGHVNGLGAGSDALYVANFDNNRILKYSFTGSLLASWGTSGSGNGQLRAPYGVAASQTNYIFVTEDGNNRVQKFSTDGAYVFKWGQYGSATGEFFIPRAIAVAPTGDVYVAEWGNRRVQRFSPTGQFLGSWGTQGTGDGEFESPVGIAVGPDGTVYVLDWGNNRVQRFSADGVFLSKWGAAGSGPGQFNRPEGICVSGGFVYVVDRVNHRIQTFTLGGAFVEAWGSFGSGPGQFAYPTAIAGDSFGNLYVADDLNFRIQKFQVSATAGVPDVPPVNALRLTSSHNPFSTRTTLQVLSAATTGAVPPAVLGIDVFSAVGVRVRSLPVSRWDGGALEARWDGCDDSGTRCPSGSYYVRLYGPQGSVTQAKVSLVR